MLHEVSFLSYNQRDQVQGWIYVPACRPVGIVQLIHGFGEHSRRYLKMIVQYMDAGFIVCADDHVGHGKTAIVNDNTWGNWGDKGYHTMMEDEHTLHDITVEKYPESKRLRKKSHPHSLELIFGFFHLDLIYRQ